MTDSEFIKFRTADSPASSRIGGRVQKAPAIEAERASENPYGLLGDEDGRVNNLLNPPPEEPSIREESFYNVTSNQSRRERQQERDSAGALDQNDQMLLNGPDVERSSAEAQNELPGVHAQPSFAEQMLERHEQREHDRSGGKEVESVQVSSVHFHLSQKQFRYHAG